MSTKKQPTLDDLGLADAVDVEQLVRSKPPIEIIHENPGRKREPMPTRPAPAVKAPATVPYPWLHAYIGWLRFAGVVGNVICFLLGAFGVLTSDGGIIVEAIFGLLAFNFLFVVAALVQLAIDAKADLAEIAKRLK